MEAETEGVEGRARKPKLRQGRFVIDDSLQRRALA